MHISLTKLINFFSSFYLYLVECSITFANKDNVDDDVYVDKDDVYDNVDNDDDDKDEHDNDEEYD